MNTHSELEQLLNKYLNNLISAQELVRLRELCSDNHAEDELHELVGKILAEERFPPISEHNRQQVFDELMAKAKKERAARVKRVHFLKTTWVRYAAAIIILLGTGIYWLTAIRKTNRPYAMENKLPTKDIPPGKDGAILTLADGTQVVLDSAGSGMIATQNGTEITLKGSVLAYHATGNPSSTVIYNTMTTPKGRQFQLSLPDGSKVWLNAASSIKYPTAFAGNDRTVEIYGEAYLEIQKNEHKPFKVMVDGSTMIEVTGTRFNINAYENEEAIKTTLLEGSVKVLAYEQVQMLKPGQQAQVRPDKTLKLVDNIDTGRIMAWRHGYFDFNNTDLDVMMRQLERWYDITVVYNGPVPRLGFSGQMDKNMPLSAVVRFLKSSGINIRLEGRSLIISGE